LIREILHNQEFKNEDKSHEADAAIAHGRDPLRRDKDASCRQHHVSVSNRELGYPNCSWFIRAFLTLYTCRRGAGGTSNVIKGIRHLGAEFCGVWPFHNACSRTGSVSRRECVLAPSYLTYSSAFVSIVYISYINLSICITFS
jgi:hypothetical protein